MTPHLDSEIMPQNDLTSTLLVSHTVFTFVKATLVVAEFVKDHDLGNLWTDQLTQQAAQDLQEANTVSQAQTRSFELPFRMESNVMAGRALFGCLQLPDGQRRCAIFLVHEKVTQGASKSAYRRIAPNSLELVVVSQPGSGILWPAPFTASSVCHVF